MMHLGMIVALCASLAAPSQDEASSREDGLRKSVVNISARLQPRDPSAPWSALPTEDVGGSGVVIGPGRILTNAHVVLDASEVLVESEQVGDSVPAEVLALDVGRDLALLRVDDQAFIAAHPAATLMEGLPADGARVVVMGYPIGGDALSTTRGVISRCEWGEIGLLDERGMRVQVDAAVNFGNSGGPAFVDGQVAGLVFSGIDHASASNISYLVATEEIQRFLKEAEEGNIDGNCILTAASQTLENPALRAKLGVDSSTTGTVVIDQAGGPLQAWDVITKIDGVPVDNKGQVQIEGGRKVTFDCIIGRFDPARGAIPLEVIRDGKRIAVELPAIDGRHGLVRTLINGDFPYLVWGPMVIGPVHNALLDAAILDLFWRGSPILGALEDPRPAGDRQLLAILSPLLADPLARGYETLPGQTIKSINGMPVANMKELAEIVAHGTDEWIVMEFNERGMERLVFRRADLDRATEGILERNGIRHRASRDIRALLPSD